MTFGGLRRRESECAGTRLEPRTHWQTSEEHKPGSNGYGGKHHSVAHIALAHPSEIARRKSGAIAWADVRGRRGAFTMTEAPDRSAVRVQASTYQDAGIMIGASGQWPCQRARPPA